MRPEVLFDVVTQDVRDYAKEHAFDTGQALNEGMAEKVAEFRATGGAVYRPG